MRKSEGLCPALFALLPGTDNVKGAPFEAVCADMLSSGLEYVAKDWFRTGEARAFLTVALAMDASDTVGEIELSSATYVGKYGSSLVVAGREKAEMRRVAILYSPLTGEAFCLSAEDTGGVKWEDACTEGWLANDAERIASARKTFWELVEK